MPTEIKSVSSQATIDTYADLIQVNPKDLKHFTQILIYLKEENVNAIDYKILGSNDGDDWIELKAETEIAKDGEDYEVCQDAFLYLKVQHKAAVGAAQGSTSCVISGQ